MTDTVRLELVLSLLLHRVLLRSGDDLQRVVEYLLKRFCQQHKDLLIVE